MTPRLPDPVDAARKLAQRVRDDHAQWIQGPVDRVMADAPWADREVLFSGLVAYQKERLAKVPSITKYPEAKPWVEHVLAVDKALRTQGLSDWEIAVLGNLNDYLAFRGYRLAAQQKPKSPGGKPDDNQGSPKPRMKEKCRVAYIPDTDQGVLHAKNVDDPATFWKKDRHGAGSWSDHAWQGLVYDGVGSGLHLDTEPDEIFPLPMWELISHYCKDVPTAVDFMTRYSRFMSGFNTVLHDGQKRAVALEKCSRNHIEFFHPSVGGRAHCSGMACRNPHSPQGRHQRAMREEYIRISGRPWSAKDTVDVAFFEACDTTERMLGQFMSQPGPITVDALAKLLTTPFPQGLCKNGWKFHPNQGYIEYTLITMVTLPERRKLLRWQREDPPELSWPTQPEVYQY